MKYWDYASVLSQIERSEDACYQLSASSLVLFLSALSTMECRNTWRGNSGWLTDAEKDAVDEWIDGAYTELIDPVNCEDIPPMRVVELAHRQELGTHGGSASTGHNAIPLNELISDESGLIDTFSTPSFKVAVSGLYLINASADIRNDNYKFLELYYNNSPYHFISQGQNVGGTDYCPILQDVVTLEIEKWYTLYAYCASAQATYGLGRARSSGLYEHFASLRLVYLG